MPLVHRLDPEQAVILAIDVQDKLLPLIFGQQAAVEAMELLLRGAAVFAVPAVATEQYARGLGHTVPRLSGVLQEVGAAFFEKTTFSCCGDPGIRAKLQALNRRQIVIAGIEAHVCVQQTALDLHDQGYDVYVCADAVGSRTTVDYHIALQRLRQAGIVVTTVESVLFELCGACDSPEFKSMIELIKGRRTLDPRHEL